MKVNNKSHWTGKLGLDNVNVKDLLKMFYDKKCVVTTFQLKKNKASKGKKPFTFLQWEVYYEGISGYFDKLFLTDNELYKQSKFYDK